MFKNFMITLAVVFMCFISSNGNASVSKPENFPPVNIQTELLEVQDLFYTGCIGEDEVIFVEQPVADIYIRSLATADHNPISLKKMDFLDEVRPDVDYFKQIAKNYPETEIEVWVNKDELRAEFTEVMTEVFGEGNLLPLGEGDDFGLFVVNYTITGTGDKEWDKIRQSSN